MKKPTQEYTFICERCGKIKYSKFFHQHKVGYRWGEKCQECSLKVKDGVCAYTWHRIIFTNPKRKQPAINAWELKGKYLKNPKNSGIFSIQKPAKKEQKQSKNSQKKFSDNLPF